ncbi:MAG: flagellar motor protein MotB [Desulfobacterales bacterium]|nr:flagellar motor protein MotB [Desulfobacterales bacterium]
MRQRRGQSNDDGLGPGGLRILIVSLFILLLSFFVVLNSISVIDEGRKLQAIGSLIDSFGILPGGVSVIRDEREDIFPPQAPMSSGETRDIYGLDMSTSGLVFMRTTPRGEVVSIQDRVVFDEGSYSIKPSSYFFLNKLCEIINQDEYPVEITGHTDSRPPDEKSVSSNWELSSMRALEVLKFFVVIGKVRPERLTAYGCAGHRPVASNETRQTRAQNRRVDIILDHRSRDRLKEICQEKDRSRLFVFREFMFRIFD